MISVWDEGSVSVYSLLLEALLSLCVWPSLLWTASQVKELNVPALGGPKKTEFWKRPLFDSYRPASPSYGAEGTESCFSVTAYTFFLSL